MHCQSGNGVVGALETERYKKKVIKLVLLQLLCVETNYKETFYVNFSHHKLTDHVFKYGTAEWSGHSFDAGYVRDRPSLLLFLLFYDNWSYFSKKPHFSTDLTFWWCRSSSFLCWVLIWYLTDVMHFLYLVHWSNRQRFAEKGKKPDRGQVSFSSWSDS